MSADADLPWLPAAARAPGFDFDALFDVDDYLFFYEDTLAAEDTEGQCDALCDAMGMLPGMRVLDLGCGHGRHAIALARRGYEVTGVDVVPAMIARARRDAERAGVTLDLRVGDMRALDEDGRYDRAVMLFDAFGFMPDGDNLQILARVARALRPGGMLCVDVRNRDCIARALPPTTVLQRGDAFMIDRHHFDSATGRVVDHRVTVRGGVTRSLPFSIRVFTLTELTLMLAAVGLEVSVAWGSWRAEPVSLARHRLVVFARRPG